jgi:superfamily II DNA or RNA helicase
MSYRNLEISIKYNSSKGDVIEEFYNPVLEETKDYKRAVGYFSSKILIEYVKSLKSLISNGGTIKLLISPFVSFDDFSAIKETDNVTEYTRNIIDNLFNKFLTESTITLTSSQLLLLLVEKGILEINIAIPVNESGLFHEKVGVFKDLEGNVLTILGSNNETKQAVRNNYESFHVFKSWVEGQNEYCAQNEKDFDLYWNKQDDALKILSINEALSKGVFRKFQTDKTLDELFDDLELPKVINETPSTYKFLPFKPYEYQKSAVEKWFETKQGIFKFATGSGKTKTAIYLMNELKIRRSKNMFIIVVPDKTLVNQWADELTELHYEVVKCFSDENKWKTKFRDRVDIFSTGMETHNYVVVSIDTFYSKDFIKILSLLKEDYLLVVDECHTLGTDKRLSSLPKASMKLGLSATPELFQSEEKTKILLDYFGGIIAEYSLEDAIKDEKLVGYYYYPIIVSLSEQEKETYMEITRKIVKIIGGDTDKPRDSYDEALQMLLFQRARIVYGTVEKLYELDRLLPTLSNKEKLLVYCGATSYSESMTENVYKDSTTQLSEVNVLLDKHDIKAARYTADENGKERRKNIDLFQKGTLNTLVAIKCLDEGVNIPEIERAIILSSSTNPREFIQRRGRLLRRSGTKKFAEIYDMVVLEDESGYESLNRKELTRVQEFASIAINKDEILEKFDSLFNRYIIEEGEENGR